MKRTLLKTTIFPVLLLMIFAVSSCNKEEKKSKSAERGVSVKVKASKF